MVNLENLKREDSKQEAQKAMLELEQSLTMGTYIQPNKILYKEYSDEGVPLEKFNLTLFLVNDHNFILGNGEFVPIVENHVVELEDINDYVEGQFVYRYWKEDGNVKLLKGNKDPRARQHIMTNNRLCASIMLSSVDPEKTNFRHQENSHISSYHVNVGHGNLFNTQFFWAKHSQVILTIKGGS